MLIEFVGHGDTKLEQHRGSCLSISHLYFYLFCGSLLVLLSRSTLTVYPVEPHLDFVSICPLPVSTMFSEHVREGFLLLSSLCPLLFFCCDMPSHGCLRFIHRTST